MTAAALTSVVARREADVVVRLPARQEDARTTCALSVEFLPGRILSITYEVNVLGMACLNAEVVAANVRTTLIDASTA